MPENSRRFVALFDFLGFKSLVKNQSLAWLIGNFQEVVSKIVKRISNHPGKYKGEEGKWELAKYIWFSDTVLFYTNDNSKLSLVQIIESSSLFIFYALAEGFPTRGGVTLGELYIGDERNGESFLGRAIIDAYELEQAQDWCGAILDSNVSSEEKYSRILHQFRDNHRLIEYKVPLKMGSVETYQCIEWPAYFLGGFEGAELVIRDLFLKNLNAGDPSTEIETKIRNTEEFLEYCKETDNLPD